MDTKSFRMPLNLPNRLTLLRLVFTAIFVGVLSVPYFVSQYTIALGLFVTAAITDYLDGYYARKYQLTTNFGKLMDPLADKILVMAGFIMLCEIDEDHWIPAWTVILILAREFLVTAIRLLAASHGKVIAADGLGKHKTVWQLATLIYFLMILASSEPWMEVLNFLDFFGGRPVVWTLLTVAVVLTVWSGIKYLVNNWHLIRDARY